ncbi:sigma-70 family RNA polymerase sigma factor [Streptomyces diastatochromogenes]|uniref:sigma-70 family RNA polymerase sigma factor n=1 Tax=Streptomyces diastatochromogenes TaxID=42236 RepID=UPI0036AB8E64
MAEQDRPRSQHAEALAMLAKERYHELVNWAGSRLATRGVPQSSADPEDVVQNALTSVLAVTESIGNMRAYVYTCMKHEIKRAAGRHAEGRGYASRDADVRLEDELAVHPIAETELRHVVGEALSDLPPQQRRVMLLTRELGMTQAEAAQVLGSAPGTVGVHAHRAIRALRRTLVGLGVALVAWTTWFMTFGRREIIPAAGLQSPAGAVTLGFAGTVGVLLTGLVWLVMWATGDTRLRWAEVLKALLKAVEPARADRENISPSTSSAGTEPPDHQASGWSSSDGISWEPQA